MSNIKVYTKNGCPQCEFTKRKLDELDVEYNVVNVQEDEKAFDYVKNELGLMQMPVVVKEGQEPFSGFRPDKLEEL